QRELGRGHEERHPETVVEILGENSLVYSSRPCRWRLGDNDRSHTILPVVLSQGRYPQNTLSFCRDGNRRRDIDLAPKSHYYTSTGPEVCDLLCKRPRSRRPAFHDSRKILGARSVLDGIGTELYA